VILEYIPVIAPSGKKVHASTMRAPTTTACGKTSDKGWIISLRPLNCKHCQLAVGYDCRPKRKSKKRKKSRK